MEEGGHFFPRVEYTPQDIRYTSKDDFLYAIALGWPGGRRALLLKAMAKDRLPDDMRIVDVEMLGAPEEIRRAWGDDGLAVTTPAEAADEMAVVFKIRTNQAVVGGGQSKR